MSELPCAFCGTINLWEDEDGSLDCKECVREWNNRDDFFYELHDVVVKEWQSEPEFMKKVMSDLNTESSLRRVASGLFALKADPEIIMPILVALNQSSRVPIPLGRVGDLLIEAAFAV